LQELFNAILEILLAGEPDMDGGNPSFAIDQKCGGQCVHAAVSLRCKIVADHHAIVDVEVLEEWFDHFPALVIHGDSKHAEAAVLVLALELHKPGNLDFAGAAPGGKEIQQYDLALVIGELYRFAVGVLEGEIHGGVAILLWLYRFRCTDSRRAADKKRSGHESGGENRGGMGPAPRVETLSPREKDPPAPPPASFTRPAPAR